MIESIRRWLVCGWLLAGVMSSALGAALAPDQAEQAIQERVMALAADLRCVVCQNQSLADSNASLAVDLRNEIAAMLREGKSEREVTDFMAQRYGDFVLYSPPLRPATWLLWLGPLLIMSIGMATLYRHANAGKLHPQGETDTLSEESST